MKRTTWLGPILLLCSALTSVWSRGELEEAMQWMMMEEMTSHVQAGEKAKADETGVEFVLYKNGPDKGAPAKITDPGTIHNGALSARYGLRICVFDWHNNLNSEFAKDFVSLYTHKERFFQVVVVNWTAALHDYVGARRLINYVGMQLFEYLSRIKKDINFNMNKVTIIGHGFGAHIAGTAGRMLGGKIGAIIALDPMAPLFWENTHDTVNASTAQRVIGVHTCSGLLGAYWNVGHVDFWVNRGTAPQPGCHQLDWRRAIVCSHEKSFRYFVEAVQNPKAFHAIECGKKLACTPASQREPLRTGFFEEKTTRH